MRNVWLEMTRNGTVCVLDGCEREPAYAEMLCRFDDENHAFHVNVWVTFCADCNTAYLKTGSGRSDGSKPILNAPADLLVARDRELMSKGAPE